MTVAFMRMDAAKNPDEPWLAALVDGLVHQEHRHPVAHGIALPQPRVVEDVLVLEPQQRAFVDWAGDQLEQQRVETHGGLLISRVISRVRRQRR